MTELSERSAIGDLSPAEFEKEARVLVEWISRYLAEIEGYPVLSQVHPGAVRKAFPAKPPERPGTFSELLAQFERSVLPGVTHWNHPGFFAYFAISGSAPGILAEFLTAALNVNGMLWRTSPAATELEEVTLAWLWQLLGVPGRPFGIICDTASTSTLLALAAAREAQTDLAIRSRGMGGRSDVPVLRVYTSEQAHSSVDKGAITLGIGLDNVVHVKTDDQWRLRPDRLAEAIASDRARGFRPIAVVATVGTTGTTSIGPVPEIADICERERLWLHVDASYGGVAALVPELRPLLVGVERADSFVVNPHKWLFTPVDCSALYTRHADVLRRAFTLVPEYLTTPEREDEVVNLMDYGVQLGRRFRALKLWAVMHVFGSTGLADRIRHHIRLAQKFAGWIDAERGWERVAPVPFSVVCFRCAPSEMDDAARNELNAAILERVNASGNAFLSHTKLNGRHVLRLAVGNIRTQESHVATAWGLLRGAANELTPRFSR